MTVPKTDLATRVVGALAGYPHLDRQARGLYRWTRRRHRLAAVRQRYLDLVEATLAGVVYEDDPLPFWGATTYDPELRARGGDWPSKAFTMVGSQRLRNFRSLIEQVIRERVPGDIIETGVWRGGASILARAVLAAYEVRDRRVFLADSFQGLPTPDPDRYPADRNSDFHSFAELKVSLDIVKANFGKFGLLDDQVAFLPGWFSDTIPTAPIDRIAVLRLDGDMYESTYVVLDNLYDKVSRNGWVIIDDYEVIPVCKAAVHDFLDARRLDPVIRPIDGVGVYFQKTAVR